MKIESATFDETETVKTVTVSMPIDELALMTRIMVGFAPREITDGAGTKWGDTFYELSDGAMNVMNMFFEGGVSDVIPPFTLRGGNPHGKQ